MIIQEELMICICSCVMSLDLVINTSTFSTKFINKLLIFLNMEKFLNYKYLKKSKNRLRNKKLRNQIICKKKKRNVKHLQRPQVIYIGPLNLMSSKSILLSQILKSQFYSSLKSLYKIYLIQNLFYHIYMKFTTQSEL